MAWVPNRMMLTLSSWARETMNGFVAGIEEEKNADAVSIRQLYSLCLTTVIIAFDNCQTNRIELSNESRIGK